jgi:branched-chain amino acid transport system ATP-binding protein
MLDVRGIESSYGDSQVLFGMDLAVGAGEVATLLGRNGMGKTTTVRSILGIMAPHGGEISFDGRRIDGLPSYKVAQAGIGLVPEGRQIFPNLSVRENLVATARPRQGDTDGGEDWTFDKVVDLFPALAARLESAGNQLSGGEQQMLAIGRALMTNPRLLILDEATEGLAPLIRTEIWNCLAGLKAARQSILVIDKNVEALTKIADRHHIVEKGRVVWTGSSDELRADAELQARYLGV